MLVSLYGEFFLHIPCWFLYMGSFSYTSRVGFFIWRVFLTHHVLVSFYGEFFLHIPTVMASISAEFVLHVPGEPVWPSGKVLGW